MPLTFEYEVVFSDSKTTLSIQIPKQVPLKTLDVVITPLYISISAKDYTTLIDFNNEISLTDSVVKCKNQILTIEVKNDGTNSIFKTDDQSELLKRRNESFFKFQQKQKQEADTQELERSKQKTDAEMRQHDLKNKEIIQLRKEKEEEINEIKVLTQNNDDISLKQQQLLELQQNQQNLPEVRNTQTIQLTAGFTKRKMAVPARDGRDIYADDQIGPVIPDVKKKSPLEQLQQVQSYLKQKKPDYESAVDVIQNILQQSPLYIDALLILAQVLLKQSRCDECLQISAQLIKIIQNKHELQIEQNMQQTFSLELQSKIHAIHAATLAGVGKYRDSLKYLDSAVCMNKKNNELQRDYELMKRIVDCFE